MKFNEDKFRALVLYITWQTRDDPRFGRTKLAKTLFYSDFDAYADDGRPLTGARYEHYPFGPFPPALSDVQGELVGAGVAELRGGAFEGDEKKLVPLQEPDPSSLELWERQFLDAKIAGLAEHETWRVSERSHEHPGWLATVDEEEIPYETALISREPLSTEVLKLAKRRFAEVDRRGS